jgi:hypothetical protein
MVKVAFVERKRLDPDFNIVHTDHNQSDMFTAGASYKDATTNGMASKPRSPTMWKAAPPSPTK